MKELSELRKYYNDTLHKVLRRLDRRRQWMLVLFFFSVLLFLAVGWLVVETHVPALTLLVLLPLTGYASFLYSRILRFKARFKPPVVNLILSFLGLNLVYEQQGKIELEHFQKSGLFVNNINYYNGEDLIRGTIEDAAFEMSELDVREHSQVRNQPRQVFRGIFFHIEFKEPFRGKILMLPKADKPFQSRTIKRITRSGGYRIDVPNEKFNELYLVYADATVAPSNLLHEGIYETILAFRKKTNDKSIYVSFVESHLYLAIVDSKDILEPNIWKTNASFKLVQDFYEDLSDLEWIVHDFDAYH
ncbi:MAG: DUF3137 domain-containing protein [Bacteroidota bacterium]